MESQVLGTRNLQEALDRLAHTDAVLDPASYGALLKECGNAKDLALGKRVHGHISKHGSLERNTFVGNYLVHMYGRCGSIEDARKVFDRIKLRNVFSSNIMIAAFAENGDFGSAKAIFDRCVTKNTVTWNAMFDAYARAKNLKEATNLFEAMPQKDVVSWSAIIEANAKSGDCERAMFLFKLMDLEGVMPNRVTFMIALEACADLDAIWLGITIHESIKDLGLESEVKISNTLIHMYGSCGRVREARAIFQSMPQKSTVSWNSIVSAYAWNGDLDQAKRAFDRMPQRDVVSWNSMLAAYSHSGQSDRALDLFLEMESSEANEISFVIAVDSCANLAALDAGIDIHSRASARGFVSDIRVANALLNLYAKCGSVDRAKHVFDAMETRNTVSWTAMITAFTQTAQSIQALRMIKEMDLEGVKLDGFTYVTALDACAIASAMDEGRSIHSRAIFYGYGGDTLLGNALMNLLARCGSLDGAKRAFDRIRSKDAVSLNTLIAMYATNGSGDEAIQALRSMALEGVTPDSITFMSILSACSHSGLLDLAWDLFPCILGDYGIAPAMDHYVSLLDLLARAGRLDDATDLIASMPFEPPALAWTILLGAANTHGPSAAEGLIALEPESSAPYVLLSNLKSPRSGIMGVSRV